MKWLTSWPARIGFRINAWKAARLSRFWYFLHCAGTDCGNACDWVYPYGFVPEADCPQHDTPKYMRATRWLDRMALAGQFWDWLRGRF